MKLGLITMMHTLRMAPEPAPSGAPPAGDPPAPPAGGNWHDSITDADLKQYVTTKGWKDPGSLADSYRNLEKIHGVPKERLLKLPENFDDEKSMGEIYDRFGRPKEAKDYSFKGADENFDKWARENFHKLGFSNKQATGLIEQYDAMVKAANEKADNEFKAKVENETNELKTKWGSAYEQNVKVAKAAGKQFGMSDEHLDALEAVLGFAGTMNFLHSIGSKVGEAPFISGDTKPAEGILSPAAAQAEINNLMKDKNFSAALMSGDTAAKNRWEKLNKMAASAYTP